LAEVLSVRPEWWTPTVKAMAIVGIVLGLRFAHSLGLLHGHLTTSNILFNSDHCIQIVDFEPRLLHAGESENEEETPLQRLSREERRPTTDVDAFSSIAEEIVIGQRRFRNVYSRLTSYLMSPYMLTERVNSFDDILGALKDGDFEIERGVDPDVVSAFVNWVESAEEPKK
jgi:serine/threonine protein kinase